MMVTGALQTVLVRILRVRPSRGRPIACLLIPSPGVEVSRLLGRGSIIGRPFPDPQTYVFVAPIDG